MRAIRQFEMNEEAFNMNEYDRLLLFLKYMDDLEVYEGAVSTIIERALGARYKVKLMREQPAVKEAEDLFLKCKKRLFRIAGEQGKPEVSIQLDRKRGDYPANSDFNGRNGG